MPKRRNIYVLLAVCLVMLVLPGAASAKEPGGRNGLNRTKIRNTTAWHMALGYAASDIDPASPGDADRITGDFTVTGGTAGTDYRYEEHVLYILTDTPLAISGETAVDRIFITSGVNANITLHGLSIQIPDGSHLPAFEIADGSSGNVTVTLADGSTNVLKSGMWCAGIQKDGAGNVGTLTIRCQKADIPGHVCTAGCGFLTAAGYWGAGIGSGASEDSKAHAVKNITISGGNIRASSATHGAGIGAGSMGTAENLIICGGIVEAAGGAMGVGIGDYPASHIVTISGGRVTATGGSLPAVGGNGNSAFGIGGRLATSDASGKPGNVCIVTNSLADTSEQSAWSGVILIGTEGRVWGSSVQLSYSVEVPEGTVLTVPKSSVLTIESGAVVSVKGKLYVDGGISGAGQISGGNILYRLTVMNGEASGNLDNGYVKEGEQISLTPDRSSLSGMVFAGWKCTPADLKISGNQFRMPASPVTVEAQYERRQETYTGHVHSYGGWNYDRSGHWRECYGCGRRGSYGSHIFTSWTTADGRRYEQCKTCGYQVVSAAYGNLIPGGAAAGSGSGAGAASGGPLEAPSGGSTGTAPAAPSAVPGEKPGESAAGSGTESTAASASGAGTEANTGTGTSDGAASHKKPGASDGTSADRFWGNTGTGKDSGTASKPQSGGSTGAGPSGTGQQQKPSETDGDDRLETTEAENSSEDVPVVVTLPSKGEAEPSDENGLSGADNKSAGGTAGEIIFGRLPWWFWVFVFVGIAAAVITFAVVSERAYDESSFEDEDNDIK